MIIYQPDDLISIAEVVRPKLQRPLCRQARAYDHYLLAEYVSSLHHLQHRVSDHAYVQQHERAEQYDEQSRRLIARAQEINQNDRRNPTRKHRREDVSHGVEDRLHLSIRPRMAQEDQKNHRHPAVNICARVHVMRMVPKIDRVAQKERYMFGNHNSYIVEQHE